MHGLLGEPLTIRREAAAAPGSVFSGPYYNLPSVTSAPAPPCRGCGAALPPPFLDHGVQPVANGFHQPGAPAAPTFPIAYAYCPACHLVQLLAPPPPAALFRPEYPFFTGSSAGMRAYYATLAATLRRRWRPTSIVEIGCNDGTFLQHFASLDHLGVDPAMSVPAAAGLRVEQAPFGLDTACRLAAAGTRNVSLICAFHCLTHVAAVRDFLSGVDVLLAPDGVLVLEDPSLDAIVQAGAFDQFYDEHAGVFSLPALAALLARHGLEVIDAERVPVHGGSLRVTAARQGRHQINSRVGEVLQAEGYLTHAATYAQFAQRVESKARRLARSLIDCRARGERVAGYGASSKLTLLLNLVANRAVAGSMGSAVSGIEYVTDTTPAKIGTLVPGTTIPVISREDALGRLPDVFLLGAYVHAREVLAQEREYLAAGRRFLVWNPDVRLLGSDSPEAREAQAAQEPAAC